MRSKDFIREAEIDDLLAQQQAQDDQKAQAKANTPYNQSKLGNFIGGTAKPTSTVGKALNTLNPTNVISKLGGVAGGLNNALKVGAHSGLGGVQVGYKGAPGDQAAANQATPTTPTAGSAIAYVPGKIDTNVAAYLTKAANKMPLKTGTGNTNIDNILKAAGLLKQ